MGTRLSIFSRGKSGICDFAIFYLITFFCQPTTPVKCELSEIKVFYERNLHFFTTSIRGLDCRYYFEASHRVESYVEFPNSHWK